MLRKLTFYLFLGHCLNCQAQYNEFHILLNDPSYYFIDGPNKFLLEKEVQHHGILDIAYPWWARRADAPDGTYYIYTTRPSDAQGIPMDTISYEVISYENGKPTGWARTFNYSDTSLLHEKLYENGLLKKSTEYKRDLTGEIGGWFFGFQVYPEHYYPYNKDEWLMIVEIYDSLKLMRAEVTISNHSSSQILYEMDAVLDGFGHSTKHYFLDAQHSLAQEIIVTEETLTMKRWCEDGELFYHLEQKIRPAPEQDTWAVLESRLIKNRTYLTDQPRFYYCE